MAPVDDEHRPSATHVRAPPPPRLVPDRVELDLPLGTRVIVVSDIHLGDTPTGAATLTTTTLAAALATIDGDGVLVIAGDGFEMLACPPDVGAILDAHPDFVAAVSTFSAGLDHQVVVLPGNHDGQLAWDADAVATVTERLGVDHVAMSCDLVMATGTGPERIRVVHGNQDDPFNAFVDVRAPLDTPLGHHVVREILPRIDPGPEPGTLLEDIRWLNDTEQIADFVGSRLLYRKVIGRLWWVAVPFAAALALRLVAFLPGIDDVMRAGGERWLIGLGIAAAFVTLVAAAAAAGTMLRVHGALATATASASGGPVGHNATARDRAAHLVASGYAGLITGHTHIPELSVVGSGFYANSGCGIRSVVSRPTRFGLPATFLPVRRCSRVELTAGRILEVRLVTGDEPMRSPVLLERLLTRTDHTRPSEPTVVAALPDGGTWPIDTGRFGDWVGRRRVRRIAAGLLVAAGVLDVVSVFVRPMREIGVAERLLPFTVYPLAGVGAVVGGLALIGVARGVRLGRRRAWVVSIALLTVAAVAHILKGNHIEEGVLGALLAGWLAIEHRHFRVNPTGRGRFVAQLVMAGLFAAALIAGLGVAGPDDAGSLARPTIALVVGGVAVLAVLVGRFRARPTTNPEDQALAASVVAHYGTGGLDHLALDPGNLWLFSGATAIPYTVADRHMTVAPDPVGPPEERADAWADAMDHADTYGWTISVWAAAPLWLPVYRAAGLTDIFVGDQLVVDVAVIDLDGDAAAPLRAERTELTTQGFTTTVTASAHLDTFTVELCDDTGRRIATHGYAWVGAGETYVSVDDAHRPRSNSQPTATDDILIMEAIGWVQRHRGSKLVVAPPRGDRRRRPLGVRWTPIAGATLLPRYRVVGTALSDPVRR